MKQPAQQRHRERLDRPVDEQRDADAAPVLAHLVQRAEVDLQQHRDDHHPDQQGDRQVDLGDFHAPMAWKRRAAEMAERDADDDAQGDPDGQVARSIWPLSNSPASSSPPGRAATSSTRSASPVCARSSAT
jgi:hypothetical protein